jgi:hypothetical protein
LLRLLNDPAIALAHYVKPESIDGTPDADIKHQGCAECSAFIATVDDLIARDKEK